MNSAPRLFDVELDSDISGLVNTVVRNKNEMRFTVVVFVLIVNCLLIYCLEQNVGVKILHVPLLDRRNRCVLEDRT